ncbi:MAG TPA: hypothetical protein DEF00_04945 [Candidatus Taylorbacteria bacterium]|nr:MAG: hypothetical protein UY03_C0002G0005 [Parcubacteria group bacterium GW2011_GWA2_47_64]KKU96721.1 MAG: hypothetical protein UY29_C0007G0007 [Parcubacteria group bacterium GW2011_GWC2_48_17]HBV01694.1 hypothetical protein [Candidatus Taylorbacteria bacterium]
MPINSKLLTGFRTTQHIHNFSDVPDGILLVLAKDVTTTGPKRRTYPRGSAGRKRKSYSKGVILQMEDGSKIPVRVDFLELQIATPQPKQTTLIPYVSSL